MNFEITLTLLAITGLLIVGYVSNSGINTEFKPGDDINNRIVQSIKSIEGELSGFDCAVVGEYCPTTHRGADYTTGVFNKEDESFYFVVNIPQSFLQQYFRNTVEVSGTSYNPYNHAVEPETIHVIEDDDRRLVYESGYFIDEDGNRATFQDGIFKNGKWVVPK
ncbi:MAG: hypothetical protein HUJ22_00815 [Gracilimonas sp.]|uniref:hypothetical protein n=1 Tax=Gracilimonas sp. TaxID=1974203 RepID=UPI0019A745F8|nr:hypothetical protein [Gracilimonas sp.]MBD3615082.1 hypothetical protein [Gracilimonas sp.]